jgi:hypothetical protein
MTCENSETPERITLNAVLRQIDLLKALVIAGELELAASVGGRIAEHIQTLHQADLQDLQIALAR